MAEEDEIFAGAKSSASIPSWKLVIITGLLVFAFMSASDIIASAQSEQFIYVPIITPLFDFPPHIFQTKEGWAARKDNSKLIRNSQFETEAVFFSPLLQFLIVVGTFIGLVLLVIFK